MRCKECGTLLWSDYSKHLGICPECKDVDGDNKELESQLDQILGANNETMD